ncbi:hypothetical protein [Conexibacter woesei]|nr:hypothetical protein [Conexibacter woesei]
MSQNTTCRTCGASLAPDQRYCLACGERVAAPRLDFAAELDAPPAASAPSPGASPGASPTAAPAASGGAPPPSRLDRVGGPMGAAAVVLVALGVGFLIGQGGNEPPTVTQPAPVVNFQGGTGGGTGAPVDGATTDEGATDATGGDAGSGGRARTAGGRRAAAEDARRVLDSLRDIPKSDGGEDTGGDINRLRALPDETATPGAPPPRDDREAGGGTEAFEIG